MALVVDVDRPRARKLLLLLPARLVAFVPDQVARLFDWRNDDARDARLCGAGSLRVELRPFFRLVDAFRPVGGPVPSLDDGREPVSCSGSDPWPRFRPR